MTNNDTPDPAPENDHHALLADLQRLRAVVDQYDTDRSPSTRQASVSARRCSYDRPNSTR